MSPSKRIFNQQTILDALGHNVILMYSTLYDFTYFITFKRALKSYAASYSDPETQVIEDFEFFADIPDPVVQHSYATHNTIIALFHNLVDSGMVLEEELDYEQAHQRAFVFQPTFRFGFKKKSYGLMLYHYERYFENCIRSLFNFACAFTLQSYTVPFTMQSQVSFHSSDCLWILDDGQPVVQMLITALQELQSSARQLYAATEGKKRSPKY